MYIEHSTTALNTPVFFRPLLSTIIFGFTPRRAATCWTLLLSTERRRYRAFGGHRLGNSAGVFDVVNNDRAAARQNR